jgi:hypothetical protein
LFAHFPACGVGRFVIHFSTRREINVSGTGLELRDSIFYTYLNERI